MPRITPGFRNTALTIAALLAAHPRFAPAALITPIWNGASANWEDATQWNPNVIPNNTVTDLYAPSINAGNASLNSSVTVAGITLGSNASLHVTSGNSLTLSGQSASTIAGRLDLDASASAYLTNIVLIGQPATTALVTGAGDLHFTGSANTWTSGVLGGTGTTYVDAGASLAMPSSIANSDGPIVNNGTMTASGVNWIFNSNGSFTNNGTMSITTPSFLAGTIESLNTPQGAFNNHGLLSISAAAPGVSGVVNATLPFNNDGIVSLGGTSNSFTLTLTNAGTISGTLTAGSNSQFIFNTTVSLNSAMLLGTGLFAFNPAGISLQGTSQASNLSLSRASGSGNLIITSSLNIPVSLSNFPNLISTTGTITISPGATLAIPVDTVPTGKPPTALALTLSQTQFVNQGSASVPQMLDVFRDVLSATLLLNNSASFINSGSLTLNGGLNVDSDGLPGSSFSNTGAIFVGSSSTMTVNAPFSNSGTMAFNSTSNTAPAAMMFNVNFTSSGGTIGTPAASKSEVLINQSISVTADSQLYHAYFGGSTTLSSAVVQGNGKITTSGSAWLAGTISSPIEVNSAAVAVHTRFTGEFVNDGSNFFIATQGPKIIDGASFVIDSGALVDWIDYWGLWTTPAGSGHELDLKDGATIINNGKFYIYNTNNSFADVILNADGNPANALYNHGTFGRKASSLVTFSVPASMRVPVYNDGFIDVQASGLDFAAGFQDVSSPAQPSTFNVAANATLSFSGGAVAIVSPMSNINGTVLFNASSQSLASISGSGQVFVGTTLISDGIVVSSLTLTASALDTIRVGGLNSGTSKVNTLSLATDTNGSFTSTLNLNDNKFILQSTSPLDKSLKASFLQSALASGMNGGNWMGQGITSGTVAADQSAAGSHLTTLGLFDNADMGFSTIGGQSVDANSLLIATTLIGDANLDGTIGLADFEDWYGHVLQAAPFTEDGDFNHDGVVDGLDFDLWFNAAGANAQPILDSLGLDKATLSALRAAPVPEPATMALLLTVSPLLLKRRWKHRR